MFIWWSPWIDHGPGLISFNLANFSAVSMRRTAQQSNPNNLVKLQLGSLKGHRRPTLTTAWFPETWPDQALAAACIGFSRAKLLEWQPAEARNSEFPGYCGLVISVNQIVSPWHPMTCMLGRHPQISIQCHCSEFVKFGPSYSGWVSVIIVVIASCTNGKKPNGRSGKNCQEKTPAPVAWSCGLWAHLSFVLDAMGQSMDSWWWSETWRLQEWWWLIMTVKLCFSFSFFYL